MESTTFLPTLHLKLTWSFVQEPQNSIINDRTLLCYDSQLAQLTGILYFCVAAGEVAGSQLVSTPVCTEVEPWGNMR